MKTNDHFLTTIRWIARISGLLIVGSTIFMAVGYFLEGRQRHPNAPFLSGLAPLVIITFIVWGLGLVGLLLRWWKERQSGFLSLACFILVLILSLSNGEAPDRRSALLPVLMFSIPSVLFICCWRMIPKTTPPVNEFATLEWVELFNRRRLLGPIGYVPPAEFEAAYYRGRENPAMGAGLQ